MKPLENCHQDHQQKEHHLSQYDSVNWISGKNDLILSLLTRAINLFNFLKITSIYFVKVNIKSHVNSYPIELINQFSIFKQFNGFLLCCILKLVYSYAITS